MLWSLEYAAGIDTVILACYEWIEIERKNSFNICTSKKLSLPDQVLKITRTFFGD